MMQYIDSIKKWTSASLEEHIRVADDKISCEAGAVNIRTDDAD